MCAQVSRDKKTWNKVPFFNTGDELNDISQYLDDGEWLVKFDDQKWFIEVKEKKVRLKHAKSK
jgi:hypothetical protein